MFTTCILFPSLTTKADSMYKGASKQSPDLKNYTAPRHTPPPPGSKIPRSATVICPLREKLTIHIYYIVLKF